MPTARSGFVDSALNNSIKGTLMKFPSTLKILLCLCGFALMPERLSACASCGCTLSSDWGSLGFSTSYGFKVDFRYDYLNQDQLRSGTGTLSASDASKISNDGDPQEVEKYTTNNYLTLGLEYNVRPSLGVNIQLPYILRSHTTLGTASNGNVGGDGGGQYHSETYNLGDFKVIGRYQGFFDTMHNLGVLVGAKLPTGSHTETGTSTDTTSPGPADIDRGLQPGTGTTDLILGVYYFDGLSKNWNYFAQLIYQHALYMKDHFQPGDGTNVNLGMRYMGFPHLTPQVQLNGRYVVHDVGANSDPVSTGGTLVYISPGVVVPIVRGLGIYGFTQIPIFQNVNGVQLVPLYSASLGVRATF
jgi:hypothetical protein